MKLLNGVILSSYQKVCFHTGMWQQLYSHHAPISHLFTQVFFWFSPFFYTSTSVHCKQSYRSLAWVFLDKILNACHVADSVDLEAFLVLTVVTVATSKTLGKQDFI